MHGDREKRAQRFNEVLSRRVDLLLLLQSEFSSRRLAEMLRLPSLSVSVVEGRRRDVRIIVELFVECQVVLCKCLTTRKRRKSSVFLLLRSIDRRTEKRILQRAGSTIGSRQSRRVGRRMSAGQVRKSAGTIDHLLLLLELLQRQHRRCSTRTFSKFSSPRRSSGDRRHLIRAQINHHQSSHRARSVT